MKITASALALLFFIAPVCYAQTGSVMINEIAWMGSAASASDEWIELYNPADTAINLNGWTLTSSNKKISIFLKGAIGANGFYLLERTDNNSVPAVAADLIYKGALTNGGMHLKLLDAQGRIADEADYAEGWPAGNTATRQTMERNENAWHTSKTAGGTPKAQNSIPDTPAAVLPKEGKSGNTVNVGTAAASNSNAFAADGLLASNSLHPWALFAIAVGICIACAITMFIINIKFKNHVRP